MRDKLPVHIEERQLPKDEFRVEVNREYSYGYVSFMYMTSLIITAASVIAVVVLGK